MGKNPFESPFAGYEIRLHITNKNILVGHHSYYSGYYHGRHFEENVRYRIRNVMTSTNSSVANTALSVRVQLLSWQAIKATGMTGFPHIHSITNPTSPKQKTDIPLKGTPSPAMMYGSELRP